MDAIKIQLVMLFLVCGLVPAAAQSFNGVSCDDVRHLSKAEQDYWSQRLNLSSAQRHRIYVACYEKYNPRGTTQDIVANISR
ncbi:MAG: hypothetical protein ABSC72_01865 [Methylovirgula sp.]|jgi:hypothetical protein